MDTHVLFIYLKMPAKTPTEKKMAILQMINHEKELLYGKFKNDVENRMKIAAWEAILVQAKALGLVSSERKWEYIRDNLYSGWKTSAMVSQAIVHIPSLNISPRAVTEYLIFNINI
jgi:hypothetical protein